MQCRQRFTVTSGRGTSGRLARARRLSSFWHACGGVGRGPGLTGVGHAPSQLECHIPLDHAGKRGTADAVPPVLALHSSRPTPPRLHRSSPPCPAEPCSIPSLPRSTFSLFLFPRPAPPAPCSRCRGRPARAWTGRTARRPCPGCSAGTACVAPSPPPARCGRAWCPAPAPSRTPAPAQAAASEAGQEVTLEGGWHAQQAGWIMSGVGKGRLW